MIIRCIRIISPTWVHLYFVVASVFVVQIYDSITIHLVLSSSFFLDAQHVLLYTRTLGQMINKNWYYSLISSSSQLFTFQFFFQLFDIICLRVFSFASFFKIFFLLFIDICIVSLPFHKISNNCVEQRTLTKLIL